MVRQSFSNKMAEPKRKILVHTCCAACASHVFSLLAKAGFSVIAYYFNPEIDEPEEYRQRLSDLEKYCETSKFKLLAPDYEPEEFLSLTQPFKDKDSIKYITERDRYQRRRCNLCNSLIIQKTIEQAKKLKLKFFTTTLLCSPYKDHDEIVELSNEKALDYSMNFYYQDFRKGYWMGRNFARNHHFYLPGFCGCSESKIERRLE